MRRNVFGISVATMMFVTVVVWGAQSDQNNPFTGTWKLNVAKSKFSPGPAPKSETVTIAPDKKVSVETVTAEDKTEKWSYTAADNTAVPVEGRENSTVVEKMAGSTVDHTWKAGNETQTGHGVVSKGGKTLKYTLNGNNAQGQHEHDILIFEKQ